MRIIQILIFSVLTSGLLITPVKAQSIDDSYTQIKPAQPTQSGDKIEVVEIFWYGCSHCFSFEPHIEAWQENIPEDVVFRRVPGALNKSWIPHARAFYAAKKMGALEKLHRPLFKAIHQNRRKIFTRESLIDFAQETGIDKEKFTKHYDSNETKIKMKQAFFLARNARITGVPAVIVNGKYLVSASSAGSFERMIETMNYLTGVERRQ